jgi:outer membrane protein TolC
MSFMANSKYELFRDSKLQVFYDVQKTWYELYKIQKDISISEKNIEILKVIERLALIRFKSASSGSPGTTSSNTGRSSGSALTGSAGSSGMQTMGAGQGNSGSFSSSQSAASMQIETMSSSSGSPGLADLYRIQMEAGELDNNIALLKNQKQSIIARFNSYLNRPPAAPVFINEEFTADSMRLSLITVSDSILEKNPMLRMLEFEMQSIEARKKMVTAMGYPMVGAGLNYSLISKTQFPMGMPSMNGRDMLMPMMTVTLPIYRKKYNSMAKEAELLKSAASQNYQATSNLLQNEYYQAVQLYLDAQRRVKLYENQFQLASKSLELILKSFSTSSSGLTDVLRMRQQTLDYELKQVEAFADFNTAAAWLKRLGNLEMDGNKWK